MSDYMRQDELYGEGFGQRVVQFALAAKAPREMLKSFVEERYRLSGMLNLAAGSVSFEVPILGKSFALKVETYAGSREIRFFKLTPKDREDIYWAAYWVRGKGMKVYGDYAAFERDVTLLKMTL